MLLAVCMLGFLAALHYALSLVSLSGVENENNGMPVALLVAIGTYARFGERGVVRRRLCPVAPESPNPSLSKRVEQLSVIEPPLDQGQELATSDKPPPKSRRTPRHIKARYDA
jgi:hypothetical protein